MQTFKNINQGTQLARLVTGKQYKLPVSPNTYQRLHLGFYQWYALNLGYEKGVA